MVYLYSVDLKLITLCIAFGTTQFEKQFGSSRFAFPRMREAAGRLQGLYDSVVPSRYSRAPIQLAANRKHKLHFAYEQSAIFSLSPYQISNLPSEQALRSDLAEIASIYNSIMEDPLRPEISELLQSVVPKAASAEVLDVRDFHPRPPAKQSNGKRSSAAKRRYSPQSQKVGNAGERAVFEYEKSKLRACGRGDLIPKISHHAADGQFPGWDITSFDEDGREIYIEVKSTIGSDISSLDITSNEWNAAIRTSNQNRYYIYIVTNALSARPSIERLRNPFEYVHSNQLSLEPIVFQLSLRRLIPSH